MFLRAARAFRESMGERFDLRTPQVTGLDDSGSTLKVGQAANANDASLKETFSDQNVPNAVKIRMTGPEDVQRVLDFYEANPAPGYAVRDATAQRINDGEAIIIEDEGGQIWAASVAYEQRGLGREDNAKHCWTEIGTTRVVLGGCNLQAVLFAAQALTAWFDNTPEQFIYADVHRDEPGVERNPVMNYLVSQKSKWELLQDPPADLHETCQSSLADDKKGIPVNYYRCGPAEFPHQATLVIDALNHGLYHKGTDTVIRVDGSDFNLVLKHMRELEGMYRIENPLVEVAQTKGAQDVPASLVKDH